MQRRAHSSATLPALAQGSHGPVGTETRRTKERQVLIPPTCNRQHRTCPASWLSSGGDALLCPRLCSALILHLRHRSEPAELSCNIPTGPDDALSTGQHVHGATNHQKTIQQQWIARPLAEGWLMETADSIFQLQECQRHVLPVCKKKKKKKTVNLPRRLRTKV